MLLKKIYNFYHKKAEKIVDELDKDSPIKVQERYDIKPYDDIKYNLIYAHDELLVDDDNIIINV